MMFSSQQTHYSTYDISFGLAMFDVPEQHKRKMANIVPVAVVSRLTRTMHPARKPNWSFAKLECTLH